MNLVRDSLGGYIATASAKVGGHLHGSQLAGHVAPMPGYDLSTGGMKRERADSGGEGGHSSEEEMADFSDTGPRKGKKTKGRVKIKMEFIDNKLRRYTTFSKRKTGIMKKAYELSTLTGTQVMLLVASETGHVYTFATRKLQPMITSEAGKALIQTCLNSPDPPEEEGGSGHIEGENGHQDHRMSATGYEETDLSYHVQDEEDASGGEDVPSEDPLPPPPSNSPPAPPVMTIPPLVLAQLLKTGNFTVDNKNNLVSTASLQPVPLGQHNLPDAPPINESGPLNLQTRVSPSASPPSLLDAPTISSYAPPHRLPTTEIKFNLIGRKHSSLLPSNMLVPLSSKLVPAPGMLREEGVSMGQQLASGKPIPRILKKAPLDLVTMSSGDPCQLREGAPGGNLVTDRDQRFALPLDRNLTTAMPLLSKGPMTSSDLGVSRTRPSFMTSMADLQSFITMSGQARAEPTSSPAFPQNLSMPKKK